MNSSQEKYSICCEASRRESNAQMYNDGLELTQTETRDHQPGTGNHKPQTSKEHSALCVHAFKSLDNFVYNTESL